LLTLLAVCTPVFPSSATPQPPANGGAFQHGVAWLGPCGEPRVLRSDTLLRAACAIGLQTEVQACVRGCVRLSNSQPSSKRLKRPSTLQRSAESYNASKSCTSKEESETETVTLGEILYLWRRLALGGTFVSEDGLLPNPFPLSNHLGGSLSFILCCFFLSVEASSLVVHQPAPLLPPLTPSPWTVLVSKAVSCPSFRP